ncbi:MAG: hypothetical protein HYX34_11220 [Actinobacteria bacterium]|nr:hypothetical protein [Actinomycetota bacterium]
MAGPLEVRLWWPRAQGRDRSTIVLVVVGCGYESAQVGSPRLIYRTRWRRYGETCFVPVSGPRMRLVQYTARFEISLVDIMERDRRLAGRRIRVRAAVRTGSGRLLVTRPAWVRMPPPAVAPPATVDVVTEPAVMAVAEPAVEPRREPARL